MAAALEPEAAALALAQLLEQLPDDLGLTSGKEDAVADFLVAEAAGLDLAQFPAQRVVAALRAPIEAAAPDQPERNIFGLFPSKRSPLRSSLKRR